jgi:predicted phage tail protein
MCNYRYLYSNILLENILEIYKCYIPPSALMFNKRETALSVIVVAAVIVASFFAISFVTQASAQNATNATGGGASMNKTGGASMNATGGGASMNATNSTK